MPFVNAETMIWKYNHRVEGHLVSLKGRSCGWGRKTSEVTKKAEASARPTRTSRMGSNGSIAVEVAIPVHVFGDLKIQRHLRCR